VPAGWASLDNGLRTAAAFADVIARAGTVFWNGPMGVFENLRFCGGTLVVAKAVAVSPAFTVVGGGNCAAALGKFGFASRAGRGVFGVPRMRRPTRPARPGRPARW
jgi:phosphoglycerate kinase